MSLEKRVEQVGKHAVEKLIFDKADGLAAVALAVAKDVLTDMEKMKRLRGVLEDGACNERMRQFLSGLEGYQLDEVKGGLQYLSGKKAVGELKEKLQNVSGFHLEEVLQNIVVPWVKKAINSRKLSQRQKDEFAECYIQLCAVYLEKNEPELYRDYWAKEQADAILKQGGTIDSHVQEGNARLGRQIQDGMNQLQEEIGKLHPKTDAGTPKELPHFLTEPPVKVESENFLGREREMEFLKRTLETEKRVAMISGLGGIGKTTMARQLFHDLHSRYRYVAWVVYRDNLKESITENFLLYQNREYENPEERWKMLWKFVTEHASELLLFIDNVNGLVDEDEELSALRRYSITSVLTSRLEEIDGCRSFPVDFLSEDVCVDIFYRHYRKDKRRQEEEIVRSVVRRVSCHTLSVELVARYAQKKVAYTSLSQLLTELKEKNFRYPADIKVSTDHAGRSASIAEQLANLFDISLYREGIQRIAKAFSILPPEEISKETASHIEAEERDFWELTELGLLKDNGESYSMLPVVQESIRHQESVGKIQITVRDCYGLLNHFSDLDFTEVFSVHEAHKRAASIEAFIEWFDSEEERRQPVIRWLYIAAGDIYGNVGEAGKALPYYEKALELREELEKEAPSVSSKRDLSVSCNKMGDAYRALGEAKKALPYYEKALELSEELEKEAPSVSSKRDLSVGYERMGDAYRALGETKKALLYYEKDLKLSEELEKEVPSVSSKRDLSISYERMGEAYRALGEVEQALKYLSQAVEGFRLVDEAVGSSASKKDLEDVRECLRLVEKMS